MNSRFCVVGLGAHAVTKLIPAIEESGNAIAAVVSSKSSSVVNAAQQFTSLDQAIHELDGKVTFVVCTPPAVHFEQSIAVVRNGFDLIVEKPAFLSRSEALQVLELASFTGSKVMEGFMHRFSKSYKLAMQFFASNVLSELNVSFLIDKLPENTFRGLESIKDSSLFDIGSYPVSLFVDIDLVDLALSIDSYRIQERAERISVVGATRSATVSFDVGVSEEYKNEIDAKFANGDRLRISPFFYGRSGKRTAEIWSRGSFELHDIYETNTFTSMFDEFLRNEVSPHRGTIVQVATILESLSLELNDHRMHELKKP